VLWIVVMTAICVYGIELSARTQVGLLGAEILTLVLFAVVALVKVAGGDAPDGSVSPDVAWFSPFAIDSTDGLVAGLLVAVFIYWGWDSTVCVNEETSDSGTTPGRAAVASTVILVGIYVLVAVAAIAFKPENSESGDSWLGLGPPLVIGIGLMLFGAVLMFWWWGAGHREFFRRRPEVAEPGALEALPPLVAETAGVA